jgi:hypothetical protein
MKTIIAISALAAFGLTGAAAAQSTPVGGTVEKVCTLPAAWAFHSSTTGASAGQISGNTWNIPQAQLASASGAPVVGGELAIRLRGTGFCNTSHTIRVSSARGGLASDSADAPSYQLPAGFADRRPVRYEAYWVASGVSSSTVALGPKADVTASVAAASNVANYQVGVGLAPPGNRSFDLRIGVLRSAMATPLIAGDYSDTVTVTLSPTS